MFLTFWSFSWVSSRDTKLTQNTNTADRHDRDARCYQQHRFRAADVQIEWDTRPWSVAGGCTVRIETRWKFQSRGCLETGALPLDSSALSAPPRSMIRATLRVLCYSLLPPRATTPIAYFLVCGVRCRRGNNWRSDPNRCALLRIGAKTALRTLTCWCA